MSVRAIRWFGAGKCLVQDESTGETFTAARLLPGERATLERYERAGRRVPVAEQILEASPHRITPACPDYHHCTGCDLLHVSEAEEARYKALTISEVLERFAGLNAPIEQVIHVGATTRGGHRVRARLSCDWNTTPLTLGLRGFDGALANIPHCPANAAALQNVLGAVHRALDAQPCHAVRAIEALAGAQGCALTLIAQPADHTDAAAQLDAAAERLFGLSGVSAIAIETGASWDLVRGEWPDSPAVGALQLAPAPQAWTQPTPSRAAALYAWVVSLNAHRAARVLDATCGTGGLALSLAADARSLLGVDANWTAVTSATRSAERLVSAGRFPPERVHFRGGKIETVAARLLSEGARFDFTIINPMRRSLGEECMQTLAALSEGPMLYLAPAPRAGAEDVGALVRAGYAVERVAAIHLHPGTSKVMMGVFLIPQSGS